VFINPFASARGGASVTTQPGTASLREGVIIGGGVNKLARRLSLVTMIESYATVRQIEDAINSRFNGPDKLAKAASPTNVELKIPPQYAGDRQRFIQLVMHLPLASSPILREARTKALTSELGRTDESLDDAALSLEGLGSSVLGPLQALYADPRRAVNYYAARTGLRLGDELAVEVIVRHALDARSPYRMAAIRELGYCQSVGRASEALHLLLVESDTRVRIRAYESLRKVDPHSIGQIVVGERPQNFLLEVVPCEGPGLIYARRTDSRRIALIGGNRMMFRPPVLYSQPGQPVTLSAPQAAHVLQVVRKEVGGTSIGPYEVPLDVVRLTRFLGDDMRLGPERRLEGLQLDYAVVLDVLYRLCEKGAISADMRWEEPTVEDLVGPLDPMGRPESEL
jgi:hypothetical protein